MYKPISTGSIALILITLGLLSLVRGEDIQYPSGANVLNVKTGYGAAGNGTTDDTKAIQNAINDSLNNFRTIYFPNGTYRVTGHLTMGSNLYTAKFVTFQGESQAGVVLKLDSNLAGFQDANNPVSVLCTFEASSSSGQAFGINVYNLTIDIGAGNPGATALQYMGDNQCIVENVTLRSSDAGHHGKAGLDLRSYWQLCLIKNLTVDGFDYGVWSPGGYDYLVTYDGLTLKNQLVDGVFINHQISTFRNVTSTNSVPAMVLPDTMCTIVNGTFNGGAAGTSAIQSAGAQYFMRNITTSGYGHVLSVNGSVSLSATTVTEATSQTPTSLFSSSPLSSLNLPQSETPDPWGGTNPDPASNWVVAAGSTSGDVQSAIDSAATAGKKTVCVPYLSGGYNFTGTVHIHGSVTRVLLMSNIIQINNPLLSSSAPVFSVDSPDNSTVVIDRCSYSSGSQTSPFTFAYHNSNCTLVLKDLSVGGQIYNCAPGKTGTVYIEDVAGDGFNFSPGQHVYCHYINPEGNPPASMIVNNGATLWIFGLKHEQSNTVITTTGGGTTEMLGGLLYPSGGKTSAIPFVVTNSTFSGDWNESVNTNYQYFAQVTRSGNTQTLNAPGVDLPLFVERPPNPYATTPIFSVGSGTYSGAQNLVLGDATSGATIYYTTDGTTPTTSSTKYTGPITVNSSETVTAIAAASGYLNSLPGSATFTINSSTPTPVHAYTFDNNNGNDSVGNADGTLINGATISGNALQCTGPSGQGLALNGTAVTHSSVSAITGSFTIMVKVILSGNDSTNYPVLFGYGTSKSSYLLCHPHRGLLGGPATMEFDGPGFTYPVNLNLSSTGIPTGSLQTLAVTYDATNNFVAAYLNGVQTATATLPTSFNLGAISGNATGGIGGFDDYGDPSFVGSVQSFTIYNQALLSSQIQGGMTTANNVTSAGATLNGTINPGGIDTVIYFQYGTTTAYGSTTATQDIGSGTTPVSFSTVLSGLQPGTTYNYRLISITNGVTTTYANQTVTTLAQEQSTDTPTMPVMGLIALAILLMAVTAVPSINRSRL